MFMICQIQIDGLNKKELQYDSAFWNFEIGKNYHCYGGALFHPTVSMLIVSFANQPYIAISHFETKPI